MTRELMQKKIRILRKKELTLTSVICRSVLHGWVLSSHKRPLCEDSVCPWSGEALVVKTGILYSHVAHFLCLLGPDSLGMTLHKLPSLYCPSDGMHILVYTFIC